MAINRKQGIFILWYSFLLTIIKSKYCCYGRDRMVVGFTTIYAI